MINKDGVVIYVGKAKDLSKRVKQYFQQKNDHSPRTKKMVENIDDISFIVVDSELEALILELNLIKELHPKYNILMKDDKSYVYIKITDEDFPRVQIVRKIDDKKATYFGPKTAQHKVEKTFKILKKVLPFRHCSLDIREIAKSEITNKGTTRTADGAAAGVEVTRKTIKYPCLDFYIKRCAAPCIAKCSKEEYGNIIANVKRFFEGKHEDIMNSLREEMKQLAENKEFEKAARLRDRIQNVESILEKQKISDPNQEDKDIINYTSAWGKVFFNLFQVRDGKLINQENFIFQGEIQEDDKEGREEALGSFLTQYYEKTTNIPKEILIPHEPQDRKEMEEFLIKQKGSKVNLLIPERGQKSRLLELSYKNAKVFAERNSTSWQEESDQTKEAVSNLQKLLNLENPPKRIECYDISHFAGTETVGSMIVFENGAPKKQDYRKFRIRTVTDKPDDYKSLEEVLTRRLSHLKEVAAESEYQIKKAVKKDQKTIEEIIEKEHMLDKEDINYKTFFTAKKNGEIYGFVRERKIGEYTKASSLWVSEKARGKKLGHKLLKALIKSSKAKRLYLGCLPSLKDYYESIGFIEIKKLPKELEEERQKWNKEDCEQGCSLAIWFAYDNTKKQDKSFDSIPNLIIIDGGKGQLSTIKKVLKSFELTDKIPLISIAKEQEEIFVAGNSAGNPANSEDRILLDKTNPILKLIQRARDEAHRFAIEYNKTLRKKKTFG